MAPRTVKLLALAALAALASQAAADPSLRIRALGAGAKASVKLVKADDRKTQVLGFRGSEWAAADLPRTLDLATAQTIALDPTAEIARAGGGATCYQVAVTAPGQRTETFCVQMPDGDQTHELRDLASAAEIDPATLTAGRLLTGAERAALDAASAPSADNPLATRADLVGGGEGGGPETDPLFVASPAHGITATDLTHWGTAYTLAGTALQAEADPLFAASPAHGITAADLAHWGTAYTLAGTALQAETDPLFAASPAHDITAADLAHWGTAYTLAGTALQAETDPLFAASPAHGITAADLAHWGTAYTLAGTASQPGHTHTGIYEPAGGSDALRLEWIEVPITPAGAALKGGDQRPFAVPYAATLSRVHVGCLAAASVSAATVDVRRHATWGQTPTTVLSSELALSAAAEASTTAIASPSWTAEDVGVVVVTGADGGYTATDCLVTLTFLR